MVQVNAVKSRTLRIKVWGRNACFTRPEMKVERVSYDVMTPSAARGILEAILWKPAICWRITQIDVLKPIKWESVRRNEVGAVISTDNALTVMSRGKGFLGIYVDDPKVRQQRAGLFLRDVAYTIHAHFEMTERAGPEDTLIKFEEMFLRRAEKGQCFHRPYLGCREFPADFTPILEGQPLPEPSEKSQVLGFKTPHEMGYMLYDIFHEHGLDKNGNHTCNEKCQSHFFKAVIKDGKLEIPRLDLLEVHT